MHRHFEGDDSKIFAGEPERIRLLRDTDGDNVAVRWFIYPEPGTYDGAPEIRNADTLVAELTAPVVGKPETLHVILEARDDGEPALYAYRRLVLRVDPAEAQ